MPLDKHKHSTQSDFGNALETAQADECFPATELYKLGRLAHRAAGLLPPVLHGLVSDGLERPL